MFSIHLQVWDFDFAALETAYSLNSRKSSNMTKEGPFSNSSSKDWMTQPETKNKRKKTLREPQINFFPKLLFHFVGEGNLHLSDGIIRQKAGLITKKCFKVVFIKQLVSFEGNRPNFVSHPNNPIVYTEPRVQGERLVDHQTGAKWLKAYCV